MSVSRRTDIPAFYSDWFYNRIKEGFVYVRNPMNFHQVSNVCIAPDVVDCIVFWTKNARPMLSRLDEIKDYNYYFQFTINPYDQGLEINVPRKMSVIRAFQELSEKIGPHRVLWRYDPIFFTDKIDFDYHVRFFEEIARRLSSYTTTCFIGFLTNYKKTLRNMAGTTARETGKEETMELVSRLVEIASSNNIKLDSCSEKFDLRPIGVSQGYCIDRVLIENLTGCPITAKKDKNQRDICRCVESIDIGEYDSCLHDCLYCYANSNKKAVVMKNKVHNPYSPLLIGHIEREDIIKERKVTSCKCKGLFDNL